MASFDYDINPGGFATVQPVNGMKPESELFLNPFSDVLPASKWIEVIVRPASSRVIPSDVKFFFFLDSFKTSFRSLQTINQLSSLSPKLQMTMRVPWAKVLGETLARNPAVFMALGVTEWTVRHCGDTWLSMKLTKGYTFCSGGMSRSSFHMPGHGAFFGLNAQGAS